MPVQVQTAEYVISVSLPEGAASSLNELTLDAGRQLDLPIEAGAVRARMTLNATGLLRVRNSADDTVLMAVFPKHPDLVHVSPVVDALSTAAAMIYLQPGLAMEDPIAAAVLLHIIRGMPETQALAETLSQRMGDDVAAMAHGDPQVVRALVAATSALQALAAQRSRNVQPLVEADTDSESFYDADGIDRDGVAIRASLDAGRAEGSFEATNRRGRWVFLYLDGPESSFPVFPAGEPDSSFLGVVPPKPFSIPSIKDLVLDGLVNNAFWGVVDLFRGEDVLAGMVDRFREFIDDRFAPTEGAWGQESPLDLAPYSGGELGVYGLGQRISGTHGRVLAPAVLTGVTEVVLPLVSIVVDLPSGTLLGDTKSDRFKSTLRLFVELSAGYSSDIAEVITSAGRGQGLAAAGGFVRMLEGMVTDPKFIEWLSRHGPLGPDALSRAAATGVIKVLNKIYNPIAWIDSGIELANFGISTVRVIDAWHDSDALDQYTIDVSPADAARFDGELQGAVVDGASGLGIEGARVRFADPDGVPLDVARTDAAGAYRASLPAGEVRASFEAGGYVGTSARFVVEADGVTVGNAVLFAPVSDVPGDLVGTVRDATDNAGIAGAEVVIRAGVNAQEGPEAGRAIADAAGVYEIVELDAGTYTLQASAPGFSTTFEDAVVLGGERRAGADILLSPEMRLGELRVVLSWGDSPADLDSHLYTPEIEGQTHHVYYGASGAADGAPYAKLDVDDTDSFGPETVTLYRTFVGQYVYAVHNFSEAPPLTTSQARVELYDSEGLIRSWNVPVQGDGLWWEVFRIDGASLRVDSVNALIADEPR